jgi:hypothetical protein
VTKVFQAVAEVGARGFEPPFAQLLGGLPEGGLRELLEALRVILEHLEAT